jgi:hypothetical protein
MAQKKPGCVKIDTVSHMRRCVSVEIFLHKKSGIFSAEVYGEELEGKDLEVLRRDVWAKLDAFDGYEWKPYIFVEAEDMHFGDKDKFRARVGVEFYRVEIASKPNGKGEMRRPFLDEDGLEDADYMNGEFEKYPAQKMDAIESNKKERDSGRDVKGFWNSDRYTRIPYTKSAWEALLAIKARIEMADKQLKDLVAHDQVALKLESIGEKFKLLPPAEGK